MPRITINHQKLGRVMEQLSLRASRRIHSTDTLISYFQSSDLWDDTFLLFKATLSMVLCYSVLANQHRYKPTTQKTMKNCSQCTLGHWLTEHYRFSEHHWGTKGLVILWSSNLGKYGTYCNGIREKPVKIVNLKFYQKLKYFGFIL